MKNNESLSARQQLQSNVMDWLERNPAARVRVAPLAKALKADPTRLAEAMSALAEPGGPLLRCKVEVGEKDRSPGAPKQQWEYCLAAGSATAPAKPYSPPKTYRRDAEPAAGANPLVAQTPAGSGANNPGSQPSDLPASSVTTEGLAVAPAAEQSAPAADEISGQRNDEPAPCLEHTRLLSSLVQEQQADIEAKAKRIADQEAEALYLTGLAVQLKRDNEALAAELEALRREQPVAELSSIAPPFYAVAQPKKPLRRFTSMDNAQAAALAGARVGGGAEVFAMYSIGRAVRGAEWKGRT